MIESQVLCNTMGQGWCPPSPLHAESLGMVPWYEEDPLKNGRTNKRMATWNTARVLERDVHFVLFAPQRALFWKESLGMLSTNCPVTYCQRDDITCVIYECCCVIYECWCPPQKNSGLETLPHNGMVLGSGVFGGVTRIRWGHESAALMNGISAIIESGESLPLPLLV